MPCKGCGKRKRIDDKFKENIARKISKEIFNITLAKYDVLVLGCGSLMIFLDNSEMLLKIGQENGLIIVSGSIFYKNKDKAEFEMKLDLPYDKEIYLSEKYIKEIKGRYIDKDGRMFEIS